MRKTILILFGFLVLTGCGYRAPLYKSYVPVVTDTTLYRGVRADYQQLAALMEKDTEMKPVEGNTVTMVTGGQENLDQLLADVKATEISAYIEPYRFCLDSVGTVLAGILTEKARAGVDVRWITPSITDVEPEKGIAESMYKGLLEAGARIYEWQEHMMHAKQYLCDGYLTIIGSSNMDNLSLFLNYELLTLLYDERVCQQATETFLADIDTNCREVTLDEVKRWSRFRRLRNWFVRVFGGALA